MDFSFLGLVTQHASEMDFAFRSLVDTIIRYSQLSISMLRITNVTEDSFHVSLEARITKTGLASAGITAMTVKLCGPSGHFGNVTLPAVTTQRNGTDVVVTNQLVEIIDQKALKAFIQPLIRDGVMLSLRDGQTAIAAFGIGPRDIVYEKDIFLPGVNGPAISFHAASFIPSAPPGVAESPTTASLAGVTHSATTASVLSTSSGNTVSVTFQVVNPSPLEISFGTCSFDIQDHQGKLLAELKGRLDIRRGQFEVTFRGTVNKAAMAMLAADMREAARSRGRAGKNTGHCPQVRLVGKRCPGAGWCDETIKGLDVPLQNAEGLFRALGVDDGIVSP
ncbi:hypothetical protein F5B22DRAFT_287073 [Xylaria bambusicola]|uniref:uncharacterized protein n=1 Tax=Xylaria bambusicola TaxID=326684 RepID=UPI0020087D1B|nr:uncharacterized protein F5B22DRAFT_287073 [Xylaria bambusicola]KAI0512855.1 hypothetical protein F5B22DRAFT_287073 [Xylaria bambusicola]